MPIRDDEDEIFAENMVRIRESLDLSRADMVRRLRDGGWESVHQTTVTRIEKGEQPVRLREAAIIAAVLNTTVTSMLQPYFETEMSERLYRIRERLRSNRQSVHNAARHWMDAESDALALITAARDADIEPSDATYAGTGRARRGTAADEMHFVLLELDEPPEETIMQVRQRRTREGDRGAESPELIAHTVLLVDRDDA